MKTSLTQPILIALAVLILGGCEAVSTDPISLDGSWLFQYDPDSTGEALGWEKPDADRSQWLQIPVPGNWPDGDYDGMGWYAYTFDYGYPPAGYRIALSFTSVDDNATVWLNGKLLGTHTGYNKKFFFDVSDHLRKDGSNTVVVRIEDLGQGGGINKSVQLLAYRDALDLIRTQASYETMPAAPEWVQNAHLYELFPRVHSPRGNFQGIIADLPRLQELGVDVLWLMPVHPIGEVNRKGTYGSPYSVKDYYAVSPDLGTLEDFRALVDSVHSRGMHIILDFVLNHSSWDNDLITTHPEWYTRNDSGEIVAPNNDWTDVADFDYDNGELRQYMLEMLQWWLRDMDVDGFRFDVAELVPNEFWTSAKAACQSAKAEVFFLAEGAEPDLHLHGHDMTYSWNIWESLTDAAAGRAKVSTIRKEFEDEKYQYPANALRLRFTENHDKERSRSRIGDRDLNRTAWVFSALMKGNPLIYGGQERGNRQFADLFEKQTLDWQRGDFFLERKMGEILNLRREYIRPDSEFEIVLADDEKQVIAYRHGPLLAFYNFSENPFQFKAQGIDSVLSGSVTMSEGGDYILAAKEYGVFK